MSEQDWNVFARPCVFCAGPSSMDAEGVWDTRHIDDGCPMVTGLFPVTDDEFPTGVRCGDCNDVIPEGESYVNGPPPPDCPFEFPDDANVFGIYCVGCAASAAVA